MSPAGKLRVEGVGSATGVGVTARKPARVWLTTVRLAVTAIASVGTTLTGTTSGTEATRWLVARVSRTRTGLIGTYVAWAGPDTKKPVTSKTMSVVAPAGAM